MNLTLNIQYIIVLKLMEIIIESHFCIIACEELDAARSLQLAFARASPFSTLFSFSSLLLSFRLSGKAKRNSEAGHGEGKLQRVCKHLPFHILQ